MGIENVYNRAKENSRLLDKMTSEMKEYSERLNEVNAKLAKSKDIKNLFETEAGQMAMEMDAADGKIDGKISASVWNNYAAGHEGRTTISENGSISVFDAMDSITTYMVREEARENGPNAEPSEKMDPTIDYD